MDGYVTHEKKGRLSVITFFHPAHNSMPGNLLTALKEAMEEAGKDEESQLILLKSGGEKPFVQGQVLRSWQPSTILKIAGNFSWALPMSSMPSEKIEK